MLFLFIKVQAKFVQKTYCSNYCFKIFASRVNTK